MTETIIRKEKFEQITEVSENIHIVRFSKEAMIAEVYEDYKPTGKFEDTGYVKFNEECIKGKLTPEKVIKVRQEEVDKYDTSSAINGFFYNGKEMWFDKVTRTCINYSIEVEKADGKTETTLYDNDGAAHTLPIDTAIKLFAQLELYAKECYNTTQHHKARLAELTTVEDILNYDIKTNYPEKLTIVVPEDKD